MPGAHSELEGLGLNLSDVPRNMDGQLDFEAFMERNEARAQLQFEQKRSRFVDLHSHLLGMGTAQFWMEDIMKTYLMNPCPIAGKSDNVDSAGLCPEHVEWKLKDRESSTQDGASDVWIAIFGMFQQLYRKPCKTVIIKPTRNLSVEDKKETEICKPLRDAFRGAMIKPKTLEAINQVIFDDSLTLEQRVRILDSKTALEFKDTKAMPYVSVRNIVLYFMAKHCMQRHAISKENRLTENSFDKVDGRTIDEMMHKAFTTDVVYDLESLHKAFGSLDSQQTPVDWTGVVEADDPKLKNSRRDVMEKLFIVSTARAEELLSIPNVHFDARKRIFDLHCGITNEVLCSMLTSTKEAKKKQLEPIQGFTKTAWEQSVGERTIQVMQAFEYGENTAPLLKARDKFTPLFYPCKFILKDCMYRSRLFVLSLLVNHIAHHYVKAGVCYAELSIGIADALNADVWKHLVCCSSQLLEHSTAPCVEMSANGKVQLPYNSMISEFFRLEVLNRLLDQNFQSFEKCYHFLTKEKHREWTHGCIPIFTTAEFNRISGNRSNDPSDAKKECKSVTRILDWLFQYMKGRNSPVRKAQPWINEVDSAFNKLQAQRMRLQKTIEIEKNSIQSKQEELHNQKKENDKQIELIQGRIEAATQNKLQYNLGIQESQIMPSSKRLHDGYVCSDAEPAKKKPRCHKMKTRFSSAKQAIKRNPESETSAPDLNLLKDQLIILKTKQSELEKTIKVNQEKEDNCNKLLHLKEEHSEEVAVQENPKNWDQQRDTMPINFSEGHRIPAKKIKIGFLAGLPRANGLLREQGNINAGKVSSMRSPGHEQALQLLNSFIGDGEPNVESITEEINRVLENPAVSSSDGAGVFDYESSDLNAVAHLNEILTFDTESRANARGRQAETVGRRKFLQNCLRQFLVGFDVMSDEFARPFSIITHRNIQEVVQSCRKLGMARFGIRLHALESVPSFRTDPKAALVHLIVIQQTIKKLLNMLAPGQNRCGFPLRIGHGTCLAYNCCDLKIGEVDDAMIKPIMKVIDNIRKIVCGSDSPMQWPIPLELNPTSNMHLVPFLQSPGNAGNVLKRMLEANLPVILATDNDGIFTLCSARHGAHTSVCHEYSIAIEASILTAAAIEKMVNLSRSACFHSRLLPHGEQGDE